MREVVHHGVAGRGRKDWFLEPSGDDQIFDQQKKYKKKHFSVDKFLIQKYVVLRVVMNDMIDEEICP